MAIAGKRVWLLVALVAASCSANDEGSPALPSTETTSLLASLNAGEAGYEMEVSSLGEALRRTLHRPVPVASTASVDVSIAHLDGEVTARISLSVLESMADGSAQTIELTIESIGSSDGRTERALVGAVGSSAVVERDGALVVRRRTVEIVGAQPDDQAFWVERLLDAPLAMIGPMPAVALGQGAGWIVEQQSASGDTTQQTRSLIALDSDRFVVSFSSGDGALSGLIEGQVGDVMPTRQEFQVGQTLTIVTAASAG